MQWGVPQSSATVGFSSCLPSVLVALWSAGFSNSIQQPVAPLLAFSFHILHLCWRLLQLWTSPLTVSISLLLWWIRNKFRATFPTMPIKATSLVGFDSCTCSWDFGSWWPKCPHASTHHSWMGQVLSAALWRLLASVVDWCYSVFSGLCHTKSDRGGAYQW